MNKSGTKIPGGNPDVLIIGGGAAGLSAAIYAAPLKVSILTKAPIGQGAASCLAQGGVAAAIGTDDYPEAHGRDTHKTGAGTCRSIAVELLTSSGPEAIEQLIDLGVHFDRDSNNELCLGREAAHSRRRILHAGGDSTGREIMRTLGKVATKAAHIDILSDACAEELIIIDGRVRGAWARDTEGKRKAIMARAVVLATGGIGHLYEKTTNPESDTGDGIAMAASAGAQLSDLEFVQFHPTALDVTTGLDEPLPLVTEALRGEGATLVDGTGVRFMTGVHDDADLAPRDIVARAVWRKRTSGQRVFLNARKKVGAKFPKRFPTVFGYCRAAGIDPRIEPIPVVPAAHYHMGDVSVDIHGRSTVPGLWACGEVAATGVHGANRLAGNSLLEAVVFGPRVAEDILAQDLPTPIAAPQNDDKLEYLENETDYWKHLRKVAYDFVGVERDQKGLQRAVFETAEMAVSGASPRLCHAALVIMMIAVSALKRQESRGCHFRTDYPEAVDELAKRSFTTLAKTERIASGLVAGGIYQSRLA